MSDADHKQALPPGHRLGHYRLLQVLGVGGFSITYLGEHVSLNHQVAVKEYLPNEFAVREGAAVHPESSADREDFERGRARFTDEARTLTRFRHPNLVRITGYFEANNTAYIVMEYENGEALDALLEHHRTLTETQLKRVLLPVADGLCHVHAGGFLHRDIKPADVLVRRSDETPVLLDFGAARQALGRKSTLSTVIASDGYRPPERYEEDDGNQGPWTDIYALSALCYRAISGSIPIEAPRRAGALLRSEPDPLPPLDEAGIAGYSRAFLQAVNWGLRLVEAERPQSLKEWLARMNESPPSIRRRPPPKRLPKAARYEHKLYRLRIGRGRDMDVTIDSAQVSRLHAELEMLELPHGEEKPRFQYHLLDRGSTNGTFVLRNGHWQKVRQDFVAAGDRLRFGDYETTAAALHREVSGRTAGARAIWQTDSCVEKGRSENPLRRSTDTGEIMGI